MEYREAINILKTWRVTGDKEHEALNMAISALQAQDVSDTNVGDMVSRQAAIKTVRMMYERCDTLDMLDYCNLMLTALKELPSAQPEPCEDAVSREAAIDAALSAFSRGLLASPDIRKLPSVQPKPHWIPVSERLPEDTAIVTVETKMFKQKYVCKAVWIPRWSKKAEYDNWEDCSEYNEDEDEYYVLEGWYERVHNWDEYSYVGIEDDVIAWMPLPEPARLEND